MHDEDDFLRKLLENPADDTVRLVYADWLDERADEQSKTKSQFLRLTVRLNGRRRGTKWRTTLCEEMQPLAAKLPTDWLAVVSRLKVEGCAAKNAAYRQKHPLQVLDVERLFKFVCNKQWDEMTAGENDAVRRCEECRESVYYCDTITEAREHAEKGHCIAVDLGIVRRDNDLAPRLFILGPPSVVAIWEAEDKRLALDAVSLEREKQKRDQSAASDSPQTVVIELETKDESCEKRRPRKKRKPRG